MVECEETPRCFVTVGKDSFDMEFIRLEEENANLFKLGEISEHVKDFPPCDELKYGNYMLIDRTELSVWLEKRRGLSK